MNRADFQFAFDQHKDAVYRFAWRLTNSAAAAEDIAQDVFHAYAVSLLAPQRLPPTLLRDLAVEPAGIGRVLLNSQIETRREILWYGRERLAHLPETIEQYTGNNFISRTYRIMAHGQPVMLISEKFPFACPTIVQQETRLM